MPTNTSNSKPISGAQLESLDRELAKYLEFEKNESHRKYIEQLSQENRIDELHRLVGRRLKFGTAGIRGRMGAGFCQINDLTVIQITQGLISYLISSESGVEVNQGILIGHDARHNSERFARLAALAYLQKSIPVFYCQDIVPTPLVAFGVRSFKCCAGIVITASHNPKDDNGYKVYNCKGSMFNSTHELHIQRHILMDINQRPWDKAWQPELILEENHQKLDPEWSKLLIRVDKELNNRYMSFLRERLIANRKASNEQSGLHICYTPMHGVGFKFFMESLGDNAGFKNIHPVELQQAPDPDFPTVKFPNPEEANALDLAFTTADKTGSSLILANDPDADRCAVGVVDSRNGSHRVLTGNEIGSILGWWIWFGRGKNEKLAASDYYMLSSTVSSKFLDSMSKVEGFNFAETLTGFKHMTDLTQRLESEGKVVVFAYEEALGYMVDTTVLDKDGISAALQVAQCASFLSQNYSRNLCEHLDWLYSRYGYHYSLNSYYFCNDAKVIEQICSEIQLNYPSYFGTSHQFKVTRVRDLNNGYDSAMPDKRATLASSTGSFMITFFIDGNITITFRTSGTEPKIKYYSEIISKLEESHSSEECMKEEARKRLADALEAAIEHCLKPTHHKLKVAG